MKMNLLEKLEYKMASHLKRCYIKDYYQRKCLKEAVVIFMKAAFDCCDFKYNGTEIEKNSKFSPNLFSAGWTLRDTIIEVALRGFNEIPIIKVGKKHVRESGGIVKVIHKVRMLIQSGLQDVEDRHSSYLDGVEMTARAALYQRLMDIPFQVRD